METDSYPERQGHFDALHELAMDLHWSWSHVTDKVWKQLDPMLWELTHNPLVVLQTVSKNRTEQVLEDPVLRDMIGELVEAKRQRSLVPAWFQNTFPNSQLTKVAYFSMEYMVSEALPIYSGGLGNVSGDLLKTASDLGVPIVGIGLLYQKAYSRQMIYKDGSQQYVAPYNDPGQLPLTPLRTDNGEWLRIQMQLPGHVLWLRTWKVQVGRTMLLLLDSNDTANCAVYRGITNELYASDTEFRLLQEMVLGIGGWRLLKALNIDPEVCHLNEGHSAFAILERAKAFMEENDQPFDVALTATKAGNVFTTHTAVGASFDRFAPELIQKYLGDFITSNLKISIERFLALGRKDAEDKGEGFNTAFLAIRGSEYVNGVSRLHAQVSKQLFAPLFPGWPVNEVPIGYVTNGVHMPSWDSPEADKLWTEMCGKERWLGSTETMEKNISMISDERLWMLRKIRSEEFVKNIRIRYSRQLETIGCNKQEVEKAGTLFNPSHLILGFARRFVPYKRTNLLLHNKNRLKAILSNKERPVQLVLAGKAHPKDLESQNMIYEWVQFINEHHLQDKVVFLSDYDMRLTEQMVQGVDVWINTPRRPWEACGTSGMKVLVNGGLNVSELDGWWDEAYTPEVGWTFEGGEEITNDEVHDKLDAERLYTLLESEIIPLFYQRDEKGIPSAWMQQMRQSMAQLTWRFSSVRSLQEYTKKYYLPAALLFRQRIANNTEAGRGISNWKNFLDNHWKGIYYGPLAIEIDNGQYEFSVPVFLNGINPHDLAVELYANSMNGTPAVIQKMTNGTQHKDGIFLFSAKVPADRPSHYYTPRAIPVHPALSIPLECNHVLWQH